MSQRLVVGPYLYSSELEKGQNEGLSQMIERDSRSLQVAIFNCPPRGRLLEVEESPCQKALPCKVLGPPSVLREGNTGTAVLWQIKSLC